MKEMRLVAPDWSEICA